MLKPVCDSAGKTGNANTFRVNVNVAVLQPSQSITDIVQLPTYEANVGAKLYLDPEKVTKEGNVLYRSYVVVNTIVMLLVCGQHGIE